MPEFLAREDRAWLRGLLQSNGGPFVDAFRLHHPDRWPRSVSAVDLDTSKRFP